ncbi:hypothetical protein CYJ73_22770 [Gordonia terrae]|uniref:Uncharacterized protein n=1 Tax=Gordonia terrae TaxID=2055 RepID=A0A2I1R295_9ACTN|nr:hypothetical protein CYJ73_22770 [Gordonia terrae]
MSCLLINNHHLNHSCLTDNKNITSYGVAACVADVRDRRPRRWPPYRAQSTAFEASGLRRRRLRGCRRLTGPDHTPTTTRAAVRPTCEET